SAQRPKRSVGPLRDASASVAPQDTSPLPPQSPASVWRSSGSVGPATPAGRAGAGSPRGLTGSPPVVPVPLPALCRQITVELLRFLAVLQSPLLQFPGLGIYKSNLLKARVIIASYNDH